MHAKKIRLTTEVNLPENFVIVHRITRWIDEEEERIKATGETSLQYVIIDMSGK